MDPQVPGGSGYPPPPPPPSPVYAGPPAPSGTFSFGDVFGQVFSVYGANFAAFVAISALVAIPAIIAAVLFRGNPYAALIIVLVGLVTGPVGAGAITYGVYEYLRG